MKLADLETINAARAARLPAAVVTDLERGSLRVVQGEAAADDPLADAIGECLSLGKGSMTRFEGRDVFIAVHVPPVRLLLVGAVHISQVLAPMTAATGLDVTVLDPRTAFASPERFPETRLLAEWPDDVLPALGLDTFTAVALLTHDPRIDDQALIAALRAQCFYIGALGSRKTQARRRERMIEQGFTGAELARIHGPIGLDIGAVSPAEIAVSILGEIIGAMRKKAARAPAEAETAA